MTVRSRRAFSVRWTWLPVGAVTVLVILFVTIYSLSSPNSPSSVSASRISHGRASAAGNGETALPPRVLEAATSVSAQTLARVGIPRGIGTLSKVEGTQPPLTADDGKPELLYVGSEFCPFCAAERWAVVVALSHFGTFSGLSATQSSSTDEYPGTKTFSFYGSHYTSSYLDFVPVELQTNVAVDGTYPTLQRLTGGQEAILEAYDRAPYTAQPGSIPFLDIGNRFVLVGASYSPALLAGLSMSEIATALSDPASLTAQAVDGAANLLISAISDVTGATPTG